MKICIRSLAVPILVAAGLAACDQSEVPAPEAPTNAASEAGLPEGASGLYRLTTCNGSTAVSSPNEGRVFEYRMLAPDSGSPTSMKREQTIRSVVGDQVSYSETLSMEGMPPSPLEQRQARLGFLPTAASNRSIRFENAAATLTRLQPGASAELAMTETVTFDGTATAAGKATLTFVGCGVSEAIVSGAPDEPVRVYRLTMPFSTPDAPGKLVKSTELEFLVSQTRGWPIAERSPSGTLVLTSTSG